MLIRSPVKVWLESVTVHGLFHGDVHAGNLWVLHDGRLAMLDFGIVGELPPPWRESIRICSAPAPSTATTRVLRLVLGAIKGWVAHSDSTFRSGSLLCQDLNHPRSEGAFRIAIVNQFTSRR